MKHSFLLLACIACTPVLARTANDLTMLVDSTYTYSVDGSLTEKWVYSYDDNGNMIVEDGYDMEEDGTWDHECKYEYTYDSNNNLTSETYYDYVEKHVSYSRKEEYIYDATNQKIGELDYDWRDNEWYLWNKKTFEYSFDEWGRMTCCIGYKIENLDKALLNKIEYNYDDHGNMIEETYYSYNYYNDWKIEERIEYTYDSLGHKTASTFSFYSYGEIRYDGRNEFVYDDNWNITGSIYYVWRDGEWIKYEYIIGFFSGHSTDIVPTVTPARRTATRKIMSQGKIRIESQDSTFGIGGEDLT